MPLGNEGRAKNRGYHPGNPFEQIMVNKQAFLPEIARTTTLGMLKKKRDIIFIFQKGEVVLCRFFIFLQLLF